MIRLLVCIGAMVVIALVLHAKPIRAVAVVMVLWGVLPSVAAHHVTGQDSGQLAVHPATWLVLCVFLVQMVFGPRLLVAGVARHVTTVLVGVVFVTGAAWTSIVTGSGGIKLLLDQVVAPMLVFMLVVSAVQRRGDLLLLRNTILALAVAQSALAIVQWRLGRMLFFESDYEALYWFNPLKFDRWMGTTDSPLVQALLLTVASATALSLVRSPVRLGLLSLFGAGLLITQARTGVLVWLFLLAYAVLRSGVQPWVRVITLTALALAAPVVASSQLTAGVLGRWGDDSGSAHARNQALEYAFSQLPHVLVSGDGLLSSYVSARNAGLITSLENSFLMYALDTGLVLTVAYFGTQLLLIVRYGKQQVMAGATLAATIAALQQHSFSAVAASNLSGTLIWLALGLMTSAHTLGTRMSQAARGSPPVPLIRTMSDSS